MTKYKILMGDEDELKILVETALEAGWSLQGGVIFCQHNTFAQTMAK